jgi:Cerato-platanin
MRFTTSFLTLISALVSAQDSGSGTAVYDTVYDNPGLPTSAVACSSILANKGFDHIGEISTFPCVGASSTILGWGSPDCGRCYAVTYTPSNGTPVKTVNIVAIDVARTPGFVLSKAALNELTGGQAEMLGRVPVTWTAQPNSACGIP